MPKKNGVVHGDGELEDGGEGFGDVGNLAEELVSAEVNQNHDANTNKEDKRDEPVIEEDEHDDKSEDYGDDDVENSLTIGEFP